MRGAGSGGHCNKAPHTGGLQTAETPALTGGGKSKIKVVQQDWFSRGSERESARASRASAGGGQSLACAHPPISASVVSRSLLCMSVSKFRSSYKDPSYWMRAL